MQATWYCEYKTLKMPSMGWTDKKSIKNSGWGNLFQKKPFGRTIIGHI